MTTIMADVEGKKTDSRRISVETEYVQAIEVAKVFWEWRHKIMTFTFTAVAGSVVGFAWLIDRRVSPLVADIPLVVAAAVSLVARLLDARVGEVLKDMYNVGSRLEPEASTTSEREVCGRGALGQFDNHRRSRDGALAPVVVPMTTVLRRVYLVICVGLALLAASQLAFPESFWDHRPPSSVNQTLPVAGPAATAPQPGSPP